MELDNLCTAELFLSYRKLASYLAIKVGRVGTSLNGRTWEISRVDDVMFQRGLEQLMMVSWSYNLRRTSPIVLGYKMGRWAVQSIPFERKFSF